MDFVDDEDLVGRRNRPVFHRIDDLADVVDGGVGGGVHFLHIDMPALDDGAAMLAFLVEIERRMRAGLVDIVEGAGENAGGRRLADAAHAGEDEGMVDAPGLEGVGQRLDHRVLADQAFKAQRPVFAGENDIRCAGSGHQLPALAFAFSDSVFASAQPSELGAAEETRH